ncbi:transposase, mutator-like family protein [Leptospira kirschneri str. H2]|nr:transposase, mutator-like family protein [Leptospira kirschneri str. H2]
MTHHLGYEKNASSGNNPGNSRNGKSIKKLKGDFGSIDLEVPRDRNGSFEPQIIQKGQSRFTGFDDKIISMYSRGMTTREISEHLKEIYQVEVSADLISQVTDSIMGTVIEWQNRPLDKVYPILIMDALIVKVRDGPRRKQGFLFGFRNQSTRNKRDSWDLGRKNRRSKVLASDLN